MEKNVALLGLAPVAWLKGPAYHERWWSLVVAGTLACFMTACIAGIVL